METFEQVLEQYSPMISSVLRRAHVYKNHEYFRSCAVIALWQAWENYNPERGLFAPYAYRMMLTTIFTEMKKDNQYSEHQIAFDKDKLSHLSQINQVKTQTICPFEQLEDVLSELSETERKLLVDLYIHQYTYKELAKRDQVSVAALKKRRDRLFKRLREKL